MEKTPVQLRNEKLGAKVVQALEKRFFEAYYADTAAQGVAKALSLIPVGHSVSWGGSVTLQEIGLLEQLRQRDFQILDRDKAATPQQRMEIMRQALLCDTFITSTNAITEDGQLVNIDGNGNRVAAMTFGAQNVIVVAGINKVVKTVQDGLVRAQTIAAPQNVQRFPGTKTPCYATGACEDCKSSDCICAYLVTTRICRPAKKIKVILVGEPLGY